MAIQVSAVQLEVVDAGLPSARVIAIVAEVSNNKANVSPVRVQAGQLEYSSYRKDPLGHCRVHDAQLEYVSILKDPPHHCAVHGMQLEYVSNLKNSPANVAGVYIEVLRTITEKKRRAPTYVVAN